MPGDTFIVTATVRAAVGSFGRDRPMTSTIFPRLVNTKHGRRTDTRRIKVSIFHEEKKRLIVVRVR